MPAPLTSRSASHRLLCVLLTVLLAAGPVGTTPSLCAAQSDSPLEYIVPDAAAVLVLRPKQVFAADRMRLMPLEVIQAAGIKETGIDPLETEELVISVRPPLQGPPAYAVHARFSNACELKTGRLTQHTTPSRLNEQKYLKSQHPMLPSFLRPDNKSLLAAPQHVLEPLLSRTGDESPIAVRIGTAAAGDDLYAFLDLEAARPIIEMALSQVPPDFPEEARPLLEIPSLLKSVELTINISNSSLTELMVTANSEADAERVETILEEMKHVVQALFVTATEEDTETQRMLASEDPVEQAMGRYIQRIQDEIGKAILQFNVPREGTTFKLAQLDLSQNGQNQLTYVAVTGVLVALLLPAIQAAREAARRTAAMNSMKQIMLAILMYENDKKSFPNHANYSQDGKPLLSWRVHILPYLGEEALYEQFHLEEPWNSEHNQSLIPQMPAVYSDPSSALGVDQGRTHFLGVKGEGMFFDGSNEGRRIRDIRDGTSNSIAVLQVNDDRAAVWTRPDDWELDEGDAMKGLGGPHPEIFLAGFCDGHVQAILVDVNARLFKSLLTISGGENVDWNRR